MLPLVPGRFAWCSSFCSFLSFLSSSFCSFGVMVVSKDGVGTGCGGGRIAVSGFNVSVSTAVSPPPLDTVLATGFLFLSASLAAASFLPASKLGTAGAVGGLASGAALSPPAAWPPFSAPSFLSFASSLAGLATSLIFDLTLSRAPPIFSCAFSTFSAPAMSFIRSVAAAALLSSLAAGFSVFP